MGPTAAMDHVLYVIVSGISISDKASAEAPEEGFCTVPLLVRLVLKNPYRLLIEKYSILRECFLG